MYLKFAVILYALLSSAWMQTCLGEKKKGVNGAKDKVKMGDKFLEKLMDEHGFISALYWSVNEDDELAVEYCVPKDEDWCKESLAYTFPEDVGQPGRVWKSKDYEYNENVQNLDPEKFKGAVELGLKKEEPVDEDVVKAVKDKIQTK